MIYLDHAATTPMNDRVIHKMNQIEKDVYGNPSSIHQKGREAKFYLDEARLKLAQSIGASRDEIILTSGGTEANNLAIIGAAFAKQELGKHIITTKQEHHAVLNVMAFLESLGFSITYLNVDQEGMMDLKELREAIREDTILASIMYVNNETGVVQAIKDIGQLFKEKNIIFHTDAVQAFGPLPIDVTALNVDLLSMSSHKIEGPKGIGLLYKNKDIQIKPIIFGGNQEHQLRAGTENVTSALGFAEAAQRIKEERAVDNQMIEHLHNLFLSTLEDQGVPYEINGNVDNKVNNIINVYFPWVKNDILLTNLDLKQIAVSSGSACTAGAIEPSHVLLAMFGDQDERILRSIRISFSHLNTEEEIKKTVHALCELYEKLK